MASLQCSKCGEGIHYHSMPQGIEYLYFSKSLWEEICNKKFEKNNKDVDDSGKYPKLYRSSTIENDYADKYLKIWKCPICGTFHIFSDEGSVKRVYVKAHSIAENSNYENGVMFDDYLWDDITEQDLPNNLLLSIKPSFFVRMGSDFLIVSDTFDFFSVECYSLYLPEWMTFENDK